MKQVLIQINDLKKVIEELTVDGKPGEITAYVFGQWLKASKQKATDYLIVTKDEYYSLMNEINEDGLSDDVKAVFREWQHRFREVKYSQETVDAANAAQQKYISDVLNATQDLKRTLEEEKMPDGSPRFVRLTKEEAEKRYMVLTPEESQKFLENNTQ